MTASPGNINSTTELRFGISMMTTTPMMLLQKRNVGVAILMMHLMTGSAVVYAFHSQFHRQQRSWNFKPMRRVVDVSSTRRTSNAFPFTLTPLYYTDPERSDANSNDVNGNNAGEETHGGNKNKQQQQHIDDLASSLMRTLRFTDGTMTATTSSTVNGVPAMAAMAEHAVAPEVVQKEDTSEAHHVLDYTKDLVAMARPENLPGVVLFHILGSCLAYRHFETVAAAASTTAAVATTPTSISFFQLLATPSMMVTLMALLLVSSTSMLVNDYYDYKLGNDSLKPNKALQKVPLAVVKKALSYLYALSLFCATMVPGIPGRVAVIGGLILTFLYTKHVKPKTWAKNALCASLIALSPLTSGVAAMSVLTSATSNLLFEYVNWPLVRLVSLLFVGIMGREISMDINDTEDDSAHAVRTVPVVYGRPYASHIAWLSSLVVAGLAVSGPVLLTESVDPFVTLRRAALAGVGSLLQMRRYWTVAKTEGEDAHAIEVAVDEGLLSLVLLLASFV